MQLQVVELGCDRLAAAGQKARAHAIGDGAEAQIEARGLQLLLEQRLGDPDLAALDQRLDRLRRQDAGLRFAAAFTVFTWGFAIVPHPGRHWPTSWPLLPL